MNKDLFFDKILDLVSDTMGVSKELIISTCKRMEVVDARCIYNEPI